MDTETGQVDLAKVSRENVRTGAKILKTFGAVQLL